MSVQPASVCPLLEPPLEVFPLDVPPLDVPPLVVVPDVVPLEVPAPEELPPDVPFVVPLLPLLPLLPVLLLPLPLLPPLLVLPPLPEEVPCEPPSGEVPEEVELPPPQAPTVRTATLVRTTTAGRMVILLDSVGRFLVGFIRRVRYHSGRPWMHAHKIHHVKRVRAVRVVLHEKLRPPVSVLDAAEREERVDLPGVALVGEGAVPETSSALASELHDGRGIGGAKPVHERRLGVESDHRGRCNHRRRGRGRRARARRGHSLGNRG
jgi:hypothetical protein